MAREPGPLVQLGHVGTNVPHQAKRVQIHPLQLDVKQRVHLNNKSAALKREPSASLYNVQIPALVVALYAPRLGRRTALSLY